MRLLRRKVDCEFARQKIDPEIGSAASEKAESPNSGKAVQATQQLH